MTTAYGIAPDSNGSGLDPLTHRRIIKAHWANTGVICGLDVSGGTDLRYNVAAGAAVCSRGEADGYAEAYWNGGKTAAVKAGDPSNPRIDRIWVRANDISQGDSDNQVTVGVTQGTPSATPTAPALPSGCVRLMDMVMPAGATSTAQAAKSGTQDYAIPYGATLGLLSEKSDTQTVDQAWTDQWYDQLVTTVSLPTDRLVEVVYEARATTGYASDKWEAFGSYYVKLVVDGADVTDGNDEQPVHHAWVRNRIVFTTKLAKGPHTIRVQAKANTGITRFRWVGLRRVQVWDRGVSQ